MKTAKHKQTTKKEGIVLVTQFACLTAGLLESSMRLKPHEAQSYRKKALWVSWTSIVVTLILAVAAFSKHLKHTFIDIQNLLQCHKVTLLVYCAV